MPPKTKPETPTIDHAARDYALRVRNAPGWRPLPGSTLTAHLIGLSKGGQDSDYGIYPILVLEDVEDADHIVRFHAYHSIAKRQITELGAAGHLSPRERPVLTVHYAGHVKFGNTVATDKGDVYVEDKDRSDYHNYTVFLGDGSDDAVTGDDFDFSEFEVKDDKPAK